MSDKKCAEFLAAMQTNLEILEASHQSELQGFDVKSCVIFHCINDIWVTYSFTAACPPNQPLRNAIIEVIRNTSAQFRHLTVAYAPDESLDA
jgi:hypothetical protein